MSNIELTEDEKDCLQELMNVAYGSATAAITEIFDAFAKLSIPTIQIINAVDLKDYLAKELNFKDEHFVASQQINGPLSGENMFIIDKNLLQICLLNLVLVMIKFQMKILAI